MSKTEVLMDIVIFQVEGFSSRAINPSSYFEPIATSEMHGGDGLRPSLPSFSAASGGVDTVSA
jgi:hypothetical protein